MRKFILITAMVLASAAAQAGERSLTLGTDNSAPSAPAAPAQGQVAQAPAPAAATPTATDAPAAAETPRYVERPALDPKAEQSKAEQSKPEPSRSEQPYVEQPNAKRAAKKSASAPKPRKTAHRRYWTEGRIIGELHRHGIYW
jgi:hypothetical protein